MTKYVSTYVDTRSYEVKRQYLKGKILRFTHKFTLNNDDAFGKECTSEHLKMKQAINNLFLHWRYHFACILCVAEIPYEYITFVEL